MVLGPLGESFFWFLFRAVTTYLPMTLWIILGHFWGYLGDITPDRLSVSQRTSLAATKNGPPTFQNTILSQYDARSLDLLGCPVGS